MGGVLSDYNTGSSLGRRYVIVIIVSNYGAKGLQQIGLPHQASVQYYTPDIDGH